MICLRWTYNSFFSTLGQSPIRSVKLGADTHHFLSIMKKPTAVHNDGPDISDTIIACVQRLCSDQIFDWIVIDLLDLLVLERALWVLGSAKVGNKVIWCWIVHRCSLEAIGTNCWSFSWARNVSDSSHSGRSSKDKPPHCSCRYARIQWH